tara:strand:+ start:7396 stop:8913 length:1518 start_codon:yes stop_codon:yes gene_type:complete
MLEKVIGCALHGLRGEKVEVEVNISRGAKFLMVGLPDNAIKESHYRIAASLKNIGYKIPVKEIIVNLAPADLKKEGSSYDLPIALGILSASKQIKTNEICDYMVMGELSLDGMLRPIKGVLSMAVKAKEMGLKGLVIPYENFNEASLVKNIQIIGAKSLKEVIEHFSQNKKIINSNTFQKNIQTCTEKLDFKDVIGQQIAKRAIEISAAGNHNILMIGPPGSGKSMLAERIPTILPDLNEEEILETTMIYSFLGKFNYRNGLVCSPPFRSPHHTVSDVALVGGGSYPKPGEISLAHNGVLFLDEIPEFKRKVLETLRQPLENRNITISRAMNSVTFPANIMLVAAMNPSPNGHYLDFENNSYSTFKAKQYLSKLSQPLLDRIDLQIEVDPIKIDDFSKKNNESEDSLTIKGRVKSSRNIQVSRQGKYNSLLNSNELNKYCNLDEKSFNLIKRASEKQYFSARSFSRIQKIARTIADLEDCKEIRFNHVAEALQYRSLDKMKFLQN